MINPQDMWLLAVNTFIWNLGEYTLNTWLLFLRSRERPRRDHSREDRGGLPLPLYIFVINVPCFSKTKHSKNLLDMEKQLDMGIFCWEEWFNLVCQHEVKEFWIDFLEEPPPQPPPAPCSFKTNLETSYWYS